MLVYWRASVASETVLGVDNAKSRLNFKTSPFYGGDTECRLLVVKSCWESECRSINAKEATTSRGKLRLVRNSIFVS